MPRITPSGTPRGQRPSQVPAPNTPTPERAAEPAVQTPAPSVVESAAPAPVTEAPKQEEAGPLAAISKLEKENRELRALMKSFEEKLTAQPPTEQAPDLKAMAKSDLKAALAELGVSYDDVVTTFLKDPQDPTSEKFKTLETEIKRLTDARDADSKKAEEQRKADYSKAIETLTKRVTETAKDEKFSLSRMAKAEGEVVSRIERHFQETGEMRDASEVLAEIEGELEQHLIEMVKVPRVSEKVKGILSPPPPAQPAPGSKPATLTHRDNSASVQRDPSKPLTAKEIRQRMIDRINGTLAG